MTIGDRIRILRILNGLSVDALSIRAETVNRITISAYECNRFYPTRSKVINVAEALAVTASYLDYGEWDKGICAVWRPSDRKRGGFDKKSAEILSLLLPDLISEAAFDLSAKIMHIDDVVVLFGYERVITCLAFVSHGLARYFPGTELLVSDKKAPSNIEDMILNSAADCGYMVHPSLSAILKSEQFRHGDITISTNRLVKAALNIAALKRQQDQGVAVDYGDAIDYLCQTLG